MKKYLIKKFVRTSILVSGSVFILFYIIFIQTLHKIVFLNVEENLKEFAFKIYNDLEKNSENKKFIEDLKKIDKYTGIRITLIDKDGTVIIDTRENPKFMENHKDRPEIISAIEKGEGKSIRLSPTLNEYMFYYAVFVKEKEVVLRVSKNLTDIQKIFYEFKKQFGLIFLITYLIFISIFTFMIPFFLKEFSLIDEFIEKIGKGKYGEKLLGFKQKELKNIAEKLNLISEKLLLTSELEKKNVEMFEVIKFLEEPVAFFNEEGKLLNFNVNFKKFLKSPFQNRYFWEVIENFEINEIIEKTMNYKKGQEKEAEIDNRWYLLKTIYLGEKIILFMFDITTTKEIEKIRKYFIFNISHELKTPLTVIKGYAETIEDETGDSNIKNYAIIIKNQIDRLIKILENILNLSSLESKKIELEEFDLLKVVKKVYDLYKEKVEKKGLSFVLNFSDVPLIKGDEFKIEQVIINLIDNAVKFTDKGKIEINLYKEKNYVIFEVSDTGYGISKEDLPKIFDEFFIGSKSKPKAGTGLGLSIVKKIVDLHNGKIEVKSELNKGTKFKVYLPV
ncbi:MAG TPA: ATP-binding protein [bacterium]|nr:ATP-binding protein [bacterium]